MKKRARGKIGCEKTGRWTKGKPHPTQAGWELGGKKSLICKTVLLLPEAVVAHTG